MEQIEFPSHDPTHLHGGWNLFSQLPVMFLSSETTRNSSATHPNLAANFTASSSFLSCPCNDGWGPVSPTLSDITPCFLQGALMGAAALFMVVCGAWQIQSLRTTKSSIANRVGWPFYTKLVLVAVSVVLAAAQAVAYTESGIIRTSVIVNFVATIVALGLHYIEQFKSIIPSGVLLSYWLLEVIFGLGKVINLNLRHQLDTNYAVFSILFLVTAFLILAIEMSFPMEPLDPSQKSRSPHERANLFSRITFTWMAPLMKKGYVQYLTEYDLPPLPNFLKSSTTSQSFLHNWENQRGNKSLVSALSKSFGADFLLGGLFKGLQDCAAFIQPQLLRLLIKFVNEYSESLKAGKPIPLTRGLMIAGSMFIVSVGQTTCLHQYFERAFDMGMKFKSSLTSVIYNKSLVLSNETKQASTTGDIVNLMSVDVQRLQDLTQNIQIIWSGPFQIILCLVSLYNLLGNSMWAGVCIMLIMIPLNGVIARYQKKLQRTQMKNKDERSRLISEIMNNIKSLKLYGWEKPYLDRLNFVRNEKELKNLKRMGIFSAVSICTWTFAPFMVSCSTFAVYVYTHPDEALSTDIVFPALSLFNLLSFPLAVIPNVITNIVEAQVAVSRLTKFLSSPELQREAVIKCSRATKVGEVAVAIKNGTFLWSKAKGTENYKVALSNINIESKKGDLDCIVGKVGSGKSSLLQSILGDLYKLDGEVRVHGKVAYAPQVPWIMNGTVKDNIIFGHKYDAEFYDHVIKACALNIDLKILPKGDKTEVGEKGISLSGGQKARLSLARAVYARADVYLFDDPLSAVDEHVGKHLIDHVLGPSGLLKTKCRILATNNIGVLSVADNLHMISDGRLVEQGTYEDVMKQEEGLLRQLITDFGKKREGSSTPPSDKEAETKSVVENLDSDCDIDVASLRRASDASFAADEARVIAETEQSDDAKARREHLEQGKVKWDVYLEYAKACNPSSVVLFLVTTVLSMVVSVCSNVWLKHWSEVNTKYGFNPNITKYLGIYFLLGMASSLLILVQTCVMWIFCTISGSKKLHNAMAVSVLRAPMSFFETTPIGRILNRFSNDIYKVDEVLGRVFGMFFSNTTKVIFTIIVICFSTWQFIFIVAPLGVLYVYYQQYYLRTSRELRRLDSVSRSPIFANFQESLNGVTTIRAFDQVSRFKFLNQSRIDKNMSAYHPAVNANRWLAVRLEFLGSFIILSAAGLAILTLRSGHLTAGLVGLSVSYALQVTQSLNWIVRMTVEVETNIVSVERILEYSRLTPEAPEVIESHRPPTSWPSQGEITFKNYSTRYRPELDLVLKNINLSVKPHEKVGIVGRTGAGKSSLTLALFRIIEASGGNINIDAVDTSAIGLADLRHKLSIIPQDSQVFEGNIRSNLDPNNRFTEDQLWRALELSHLKDHVMKMYEERNEDDEAENALDVKVSEGGSNLSVGQRQLMCLARALLVPSHVLILDEATAAVDVETDQVLQETIRTEFKDRTILTIAHRLNTILDSDKIIVLENGAVAEFDSPQSLLKNKDSLFYALCKQGGFVDDD
ncbi:hypothetical protein PGUG_04879 [Meyerozyma guilliermondii ATCC 6260]|uniref:Metal resistance protein YCF1 n=1 Tax=Meyerozyma guilliermondii (strain ATCC 6260 / CBS 566 / DSM 6381 / JCM 1539 / NBRC 10279 / NRRL Y-324) TaxID=294746 RepID=A5DNM8_PICGU|nr:uncharacterized protein PGUG_04879 [Meyerozyma guilliermondii ATCC 6260]EDK40781.2 hypothetical protein PGUG_04879 [Meyerozyma guilliermondii ATCC 6260]